MWLVNPSFLWVLAAGSIPVIIYLLMRYRSLKVTWGANYVLEQALARLKKKRYWDQVLLIALRVLAVLAAVMAFARPASRSTTQVSGSGIHHVIVVDTSYSMLAGQRDQARWDRGIETLRRLVPTWGRGEVWSLYVIDHEPGWRVDGAAITTSDDALAALDALRPTETRASLARAFEAVAARFPAGDVEIVVLADDQDLTWKGVAGVSFGSADVPPIYWVNPPLEDRGNLAITSVRPAGDRALVDHPLRVFVGVRNFGPEPVRDAEVELLVDGAFERKEPVSLLAGQETTIHFDVVFDGPGSHYVTARLEADALAYDNTLSAGVEVESTLRVLVLRDPARKGKFDSAWRFLVVFSRVQEMADEFDEPVFEKGKLTLTPLDGPVEAGELAKADVVLLDGGRALTPELVERLREYVARGGGLVLAADQNVQAKVWNQLLGQAKLLPAPLSRLRTETGDGPRFRSLAADQFAAPALRAFETDEDGDVRAAKFYCWWEVGEPTDGTKVLSVYDDQQPFLLGMRRDLGNVLMLTAGLNGWWNNLIVREFYVPLIFRVFSEAAAGGVYPRTLGLRTAVRARVDDPDTLRAVSFAPSGGEAVGAAHSSSPAGTVAVAPGGAERSGRCSMIVSRTGGKTERIWFGVQGPRVDSDLAPMDKQLRSDVAERLGVIEAADWSQLDEALEASRSSREWYPWVLLGAGVLLIGEKLLERRFA